MKPHLIILGLLTVSISACSVNPPPILLVNNEQQLVRVDSLSIKDSIGKEVRWGGKIIELNNNKDRGQIIVLAYPLDHQAKPNFAKANRNLRFIVNIDHYLDPKNYFINRAITVIGTIDNIEKTTIAGFSYQYPIISADRYVLWYSLYNANSQNYYNYQSNTHGSNSYNRYGHDNGYSQNYIYNHDSPHIYLHDQNRYNNYSIFAPWRDHHDYIQ